MTGNLPTIPIPLRDIERATENGNTFFAQLAKQLIATMQRESDYLFALKAIRDHQDIVGGSSCKLGTTWHLANSAIKRYEVSNG